MQSIYTDPTQFVLQRSRQELCKMSRDTFEIMWVTSIFVASCRCPALSGVVLAGEFPARVDTLGTQLSGSTRSS